MRKIVVGVILVIAVLVLAVVFLRQSFLRSQKTQFANAETGIKYVPVGDSYTIGLGVAEKDRWPNRLTDHLIREGIEIHLVANPAVSGYTVKDVIEKELAVVEEVRPDLVTVLIGTNDNFRLKEAKKYRSELQELLNKLQPMMINPKNIVLITIPDYTVSPTLRQYPKDEMAGLIGEYNEIIREEGRSRGLVVADIFPVSRTMTGEADYILDGLHPSAQGYIKWERVIFPVVFDLLSQVVVGLE